MTALLEAYRRTGADLPFDDPTRAHGVGMEGYYWRFTDAAAGRVAIVLCGICRARSGTWACVALAAHPGGQLRWAAVPGAADDPLRLAVTAGDVLTADARRLRVAFDDAALEAEIDPLRPWPRRSFGALGPAHLVPGLGQYWHPHLLRGATRGSFTFAGERHSLDAATAYSEKNWGAVFASHWWWGQAHAFADAEATVAFAGGRLFGQAPTAVVVDLEGRLIRLAPPLAHVVTATAPGQWRIRASGPVHSLELEAHAEPAAAHVLPVPVIEERRAEMRSHQHLAGRLRVTVRRGRRLLFAGESALAGLERGT